MPLKSQGNDVDIRIKWPNDIYSNGMKVGGILCHSTYRQKDFHVVIGVGLNLDNGQPTTCVNDIIKHRHTELQLTSAMQPITREVSVNLVLSTSMALQIHPKPSLSCLLPSSQFSSSLIQQSPTSSAADAGNRANASCAAHISRLSSH